MTTTPKRALLALLLASCFAASAHAESHDPAEVFLSGSIRLSGNPLLTIGQDVAPSREALDYAIFARELVAYVAKEVLPKAGDEFRYNSEIPSRLSAEMPAAPSRFGAHCMIVLNQMGSMVSPFSEDVDAAPSIGSVVSGFARAGTAILALQHVLSSVKEKAVGQESVMSLDPKVGTSSFGAYVTVRW